MPWLLPIATALPFLCADDPFLPTTVQAWAEADHLFSQQMSVDEILPRVLDQLKEESFDVANARKDPFTRSCILTITRALITRGHYALSQKTFIVDKLKSLEEGPMKQQILEHVDEVDNDVMRTLGFLEQYQEKLKPNLDGIIRSLNYSLMMVISTSDLEYGNNATVTTAPMSEGSADESENEDDVVYSE